MNKEIVQLGASKKPKRTRVDRPEVLEAKRQQILSDERFIKNRTKGGPSPNPTGQNQFSTSHGAKLINEGIKLYLQDKAPDHFCAAVGLEPGATFADVIAKRQLIDSVLGGLASTTFVRDASEGSPTSKHEFSGGLALPPPCTIVFRSKEKK